MLLSSVQELKVALSRKKYLLRRTFQNPFPKRKKQEEHSKIFADCPQK